jgi:hypothetical protein
MARMKDKPISQVTLKDMMLDYKSYHGMIEGLMQLPVVEKIKIGKREYAVPQSLDEFTDKIVYGQRLFFTQKEENDFGCILRVMDGYYYSQVNKCDWDTDKALSLGKLVITCNVVDLYPVAMHLISLVADMIEREHKLLHREPSKIELAAGIEKMNLFSDMISLDFLRDAMKITIPEVLLTPYNECLVRFMIAKASADFQDRYYKLMQEDTKAKQ